MVCSQCASGTLHQGTPVGRVETVHGFPTYISEPPAGQSPKGIVVIIPDAFGWAFNNNRILADKYAARLNARVYLPEFMDGNSMAPSMLTTMDKVLGKGSMIGKVLPVVSALIGGLPFVYLNRLSVGKPRVYKFFHDLRVNEAASLPLGAAGFCWGGKFVFLLCSDSEKAANGKSLVDCGFTAHPSNLVIPQDAHAVTLPLSVAVGDVDLVLKLPDVQQTKDILEEKGKGTHELVIFPGAKHGFAIRGDPEDEKAAEKEHQAFEQAVNWFGKCFEKASH